MVFLFQTLFLYDCNGNPWLNISSSHFTGLCRPEYYIFVLATTDARLTCCVGGLISCGVWTQSYCVKARNIFPWWNSRGVIMCVKVSMCYRSLILWRSACQRVCIPTGYHLWLHTDIAVIEINLGKWSNTLRTADVVNGELYTWNAVQNDSMTVMS